MSREQIEKQAIEEMAQTVANFMYEDCNDVPFSDMRAVYDSICRANVVSCICCKIARGLTSESYRKQEWISVEERLPEREGKYLVYTYKGGIKFGEYRSYLVGEGKLCEPQFDYYVTHWMPLPEHPMMKGNEKE